MDRMQKKEGMKKILYVEDDHDIASAVKIILSKTGLDVEIASSGAEALEKADKQKYDLILLDVKLPDMSGWEIYEKLKQNHAKFAFLSIFPVPMQYRKDIGKHKIVDYIQKPFGKE